MGVFVIGGGVCHIWVGFVICGGICHIWAGFVIGGEFVKFGLLFSEVP